MNVAAADILAAYILVFGTDMNPYQSFSTGAVEIRKARPDDWKRVFKACEAAREDMQRAGVQYPAYAEVATRAQEQLAGA